MSLVSILRGRRGPSGFGYASTAEDVTQGLDLHGRNILITGVNSGLGAESARVLQMRGARILGAARTYDKAVAACQGLGSDAIPLVCELAEPAFRLKEAAVLQGHCSLFTEQLKETDLVAVVRIHRALATETIETNEVSTGHQRNCDLDTSSFE